MMGLKERPFAPLGPRSLEDLVPADHFYRRLDHALDLSFVRDLVAPYDAVAGRRSIDPVVFFRLQLVLFCEGLRSERQLMRTRADRLAARWYVGYDWDEPLPDHSSLTKIRQRYGLQTFRRFFDAIVERCRAAGLLWGAELYIDATKVDADAALDSVVPRFAIAVRAHVADLFATDAGAQGPQPPDADDAALTPPVGIGPRGEEAVALTTAHAARHDWIAAAGRQDRARIDPSYVRTADLLVSTTDPDATYMRQKNGLRLGYQTHYVVDGGKARIILAALVAPAEVMEDRPALDLLWHARFRWQLWPRQATGDKAYGTLEIIRGLEDQGIRAYIPLPEFGGRTAYFDKLAFTYEAAQDRYLCPQGTPLPFARLIKAQRVVIYRADASTCNACPSKERCTASTQGRTVSRSYDEDYFERVRAYHATEPYKKARRKRQVWVEPLFAEAKDWHGLRRFRLRRLWRVNSEALVTATGQNVKRLLSRHGWGRRPFPSGAPGLRIAASLPPSSSEARPLRPGPRVPLLVT